MDETAGEIAQKLRRGNAMYKYADGDPDGLGLALLAFHGALADWLDEQLMRDEALDHATREAASTGKPVHVLPMVVLAPSAKFDRLHAALRAHGATRPFDGSLEPWTYPPLDETARAAQAIVARLVRS